MKMEYEGWKVGRGVVITLLAFWSFTFSAQAFSLSPVSVELEASPDSVVTGQIEITNTFNEPRTYYVSVQKFTAQGEEGQPDFISAADSSGVASWLVPERTSVPLEPRETRAFAYTLTLPADAEPGGHFAAIFFSDLPPQGRGGTSIGIGAKVGALFFLRVPGEIVEAARIEDFRVSGDGVLNRLPASFELRIRNLGSVHLRPQGEIVFENVLGKTADRTQLNPQQNIILPGSARRLEPVWVKRGDLRTGDFWDEVKNEWRNFAFGRYTARVAGTYGATRQPLSAETTFWVMPRRLLFLAFLVLLSVFSGLKLYQRLLVRAVLSDAGPDMKKDV